MYPGIFGFQSFHRPNQLPDNWLMPADPVLFTTGVASVPYQFFCTEALFNRQLRRIPAQSDPFAKTMIPDTPSLNPCLSILTCLCRICPQSKIMGLRNFSYDAIFCDSHNCRYRPFLSCLISSASSSLHEGKKAGAASRSSKMSTFNSLANTLARFPRSIAY